MVEPLPKRIKICRIVVFPELVWNKIIENLYDGRDVLALSNAHQDLCNLISTRRVPFYFSEVAPLLTRYLDKKEILNCRLVCKYWKRGVDNMDNYLACTSPHKNILMRFGPMFAFGYQDRQILIKRTTNESDQVDSMRTIQTSGPYSVTCLFRDNNSFQIRPFEHWRNCITHLDVRISLLMNGKHCLNYVINILVCTPNVTSIRFYGKYNELAYNELESLPPIPYEELPNLPSLSKVCFDDDQYLQGFYENFWFKYCSQLTVVSFTLSFGIRNLNDTVHYVTELEIHHVFSYIELYRLIQMGWTDRSRKLFKLIVTLDCHFSFCDLLKCVKDSGLEMLEIRFQNLESMTYYETSEFLKTPLKISTVKWLKITETCMLTSCKFLPSFPNIEYLQIVVDREYWSLSNKMFVFEDEEVFGQIMCGVLVSNKIPDLVWERFQALQVVTFIDAENFTESKYFFRPLIATSLKK